jgi:hypothetical protein
MLKITGDNIGSEPITDFLKNYRLNEWLVQKESTMMHS